MLNSKSQAGTEVQQSDEVEVPSVKPNLPQNPLLAVVLFVFKVFTKRNIFFAFFLMLIIQNLFSQPNYIFYILLFVLGIYF